MNDDRQSGNLRANDSGVDAEWRPRLAVLLSGAGRTLERLLDAIENDELRATIVVVGSSRPGVRGLDIARSAGFPVFVAERKAVESDDAYASSVFAELEPFHPDLIILAGFLRKLAVPDQWVGRILNIHPALLPEMAAASGKGFYGDRVHAEVLRQGCLQSGATVHLVDNDYDTGEVIARKTVPVKPGDTVETLAARVFQAECALYPAAIADYIESQRETLRKGRTHVS